MRYAILLLLLAAVCPFLQLAAVSPPATISPPTSTPVFNVPDPHVELIANTTVLRVGETVTITAQQVNLGMPAFTLRLSSGVETIVNHMDEHLVGTEQDAIFEVVSSHADLEKGVFTLRALAVGEVDVTVSATGEVALSTGGYMWGIGSSEPLHLTVFASGAVIPTPTFVEPDLHVELHTSATTLSVGEIITVTGTVGDIEIPVYTLTFSSGGQFSSVNGSSEVSFTVADPLFELVSIRSDANSVTAELRAIAPGETDLVISVIGEIQYQPAAYRRIFPRSEPLHLTILAK